MCTIRPLLFCSILLFVPCTVFAQSTEGQPVRSDAFSTLLTEIESFGNNPAKRAEAAANWVQRLSLQDISWQDRIDLLPLLEVPDRVDKTNMSVRWNGQISAPADGQYIFEQLRTHRTDGKMKLWIDDALVLDSSGDGSPEGELNFAEHSFRSVPVVLQAGASAKFRLEYVFGMQEEMADSSAWGVFPTAVLFWESDAMEQQIVPKDVFRQAVGGQPGLRGEYFADSTFARRIGERTDDAIEFIWDCDAVYNPYSALKKQIVQSLMPRLTDSTFLAELKDTDIAKLATEGLVPLLAATTASQRVALIETVSKQPRLLQKISSLTLADQAQIIFMLPNSLSLDFILQWSKVCNIPAFEPGTLISGWGTYTGNNILPYRRIGQCFGESYTQDIYDIMDSHLQEEDGSCNLGLAYVVISACREHGRLGHVLLHIDEALEDATLLGDAKASWYLAKAFALETAVQHEVKPARSLPELHQALAVAESDSFRSRIQQEIVARLLTLGRDEEAKEFLSTQRSPVVASEERGDGQVQFASFTERYAAAESRRLTLSVQQYIDSVKTHREMARQRRDTIQDIRLQSILTEFESSQQSNQR